jgi:hypothetical protein
MTGWMTALVLLSTLDADRQTVVIVVGAAGASEYRVQFDTWADRWEDAAARGDAESIRIGAESDNAIPDKEELQTQLERTRDSSREPLWLVLIGHGTFDGRAAKFNLRGPDVSAQELAEWLKPSQRPLAIINCASASGPFIKQLSGPDRVVITATKSGFELNFARFGDFLSRAIQEGSVDLDKDNQTSLLEAFLAAAAGVREFYEQEARLATEHALIDDTGDGQGTPSDWFQGTRIQKVAQDGAQPDGMLASQFCLLRSDRERQMDADTRAERNRLERELEELRQNKEGRNPDEYYAELEGVLLKLARLYEQLESGNASEN